MHRSFSTALLPLSLALAACEHPTAPEARDAVAKTSGMLASGDYAQLQSGMSELYMMAAYYSARGGGGELVPSAPVSIIRNAAPDAHHATIVERMYLPPKGTGARAFSRYMLVTWSDGVEPDPRRLVAVVTNDSISEVGVPGPGSSRAHPSGSAPPIGYVVTANQADRRNWFGTEGKLLLRPGDRTGGCPYEGVNRGRSAIADLQWDSTSKLVCEQRRYTASLAAYIERGDPAHRDLLARVNPLRETLRMEETSIPGVRIVTQCTGKVAPPLDDPMDCFDTWAFWRSDDQFAPELGVHLASMRFEPAGFFVQAIDTGTGPDYRKVMGGYDVPLAYALRAWDGRVLYESAHTTVQADSIVRYTALNLPQRVGARYRIVTTPLVSGLPPAAVMVLDMTFLPFDK